MAPVDAANLGLGCALTSNLHFYYWQALSYQSDLHESARIVQVSLMSEKCVTAHTRTPPTHVSPHVIKPASDLVKLH